MSVPFIAGCALLGVAHWRQAYERECERHDALLKRAQELLLNQRPKLFAAVDAARTKETP